MSLDSSWLREALCWSGDTKYRINAYNGMLAKQHLDIRDRIISHPICQHCGCRHLRRVLLQLSSALYWDSSRELELVDCSIAMAQAYGIATHPDMTTRHIALGGAYLISSIWRFSFEKALSPILRSSNRLSNACLGSPSIRVIPRIRRFLLLVAQSFSRKHSMD